MKNLVGFSSLALTVPLIANEENINWSLEENPNAISLEDVIFEITGGEEVYESEKIVLVVPQIGENSAVIPVRVSINSPMIDGDCVENIYVLRSNNQNCRVAEIELSLANAKATFATRIKLKSQSLSEVIVIARLSNNMFIRASRMVRTVILSCG
jgi:sulfur-oxidizing protein SoxY